MPKLNVPWSIPGRKPPEWPAHEWQDRLDVLIVAGTKAGVSSSTIAASLESAAQGIRMQIATTASLSTTPRVYDPLTMKPRPQ